MGRRLTVVVAALVVYAGVAALFFVVVSAVMRGANGGAVFGGRVAVVELEGIILDVEPLMRDLRAHRDNPLVRAVVIRINSPGGVVAPTQEVHDALVRLRQAGKPVVASMGAVAASGGYYIATAADEIYANPGTLTGSIGVIMQMANLEMLMKRVGVEWVVVKAGQYKDLGNPGRPMTAEERRVLQALLEDVHGQFINAVAAGRNLEPDEVARFADGRIFSGTQAMSLNMVDSLGSLEDAILAAARRADLPTPPSVIRPRRRLSLPDLLRSQFGLGTDLLGRPALPVFKTPLYLME
jgi:protease IV